MSLVIVCKGQSMDYVKKETNERIIATKGTLIFKSSDGIKATELFIKSDSPDYNTIQKMNLPTLCHCEQEQVNTRNGSIVKYFDFRAIEEIDIPKFFTLKK